MATQKKSAILVVDDEPRILEALVCMLQREGFSVTGFTDPIEALHFFRHHSKDYGIVLSDIRMQGMNGFDLLRNIVAINPDAKVFLLTTFEIGKREFEKVMPSLRVEGFIKKPVSIETLASVLEA